MISFVARQVRPSDAIDVSFRTAEKLRAALQEAVGSAEYDAVICPFGDRWLVGAQNKKTLIIESYVVEYELGHDLRS